MFDIKLLVSKLVLSKPFDYVINLGNKYAIYDLMDLYYSVDKSSGIAYSKIILNCTVAVSDNKFAFVRCYRFGTCSELRYDFIQLSYAYSNDISFMDLDTFQYSLNASKITNDIEFANYLFYIFNLLFHFEEGFIVRDDLGVYVALDYLKGYLVLDKVDGMFGSLVNV